VNGWKEVGDVVGSFGDGVIFKILRLSPLIGDANNLLSVSIMPPQKPPGARAT
jgi:hypothetical protein